RCPIVPLPTIFIYRSTSIAYNLYIYIKLLPNNNIYTLYILLYEKVFVCIFIRYKFFFKWRKEICRLQVSYLYNLILNLNANSLYKTEHTNSTDPQNYIILKLFYIKLLFTE
uniref:Uncharacterized protein n=1 Tax=Ciona intestinalis TaxID=7719 RepID=H2XXT2_CIOIN